jgi:RHS repeat-associated protein
MSHSMIGNASIAAKQEIIHKPGFEAKTGLEYRAYIDPNFVGTGTVYEPPTGFGTQIVSPTDMNYIITTTPQETGYIIGKTYNCGQVMTDIAYFDGLGRPLQDVAVMASPGQKDMIKPYCYDFAGRADSSFLPFESPNSQDGGFDMNYSADQKNFIEANFGPAQKNYGFSQPFYEDSPLNRVLKQSAPGADWAFKPNLPGQEHVMEMEYSANESAVTGWTVENNSFVAVNYDIGQLFVFVTKNENKGSNQSVTKEYKDKIGKVVLVENLHENAMYQTRYVYDDFGLLRCVIPPKASSPENDTNLCYYYRYDCRHRMVSKKLPGTDSVWMVYDKRDRLVLSQDGKMRAEDPKQWVLTCYDKFNRPVMTGIYQHASSSTQNQMQNHYNDVVINLNDSINGNFNDTDHGYSRNVFSALCNSNCTYEVLSITYYDDYLFALNNTGAEHYGFDNTNGIVNETEVIKPKNMATGTKVKVMKKESEDKLKDWIVSAQYYDDKYRVIQTVADNPCIDGRDVVTSKYSFTGIMEVQKTQHKAFTKITEYTQRYVYDHRGRLLEQTIEGLPDQPKVMLASMHYNPAGQLIKKQVHAEASGTSYQPFIQKTDYQYNIRGWLTAINDPANTTTENDIFAMNLHYNDGMIGSANSIQYNGNIASVNWATNLNQVKSAYGFGYDELNRLTKGEYFQANDNGYSHDGSFDEKNLTYDENGNIKTLNRYGAGNTPIDLLSYAYLDNGNQISYIQDPTGDVANIIDYPGGTAATPGFEYDRNGNMTKSIDKGLDTIKYSYLNKPVEVDFGNGEKIEYIYDGTGNKIAKIVKDGDALPATSLIYSENFVYDLNQNLQYILTGEGRLVPDGNTYRFEYFMKDHLGNTRATYALAVPGLAQVAEYQNYYPFGMQVEALCYSSGADLANNHLYNGKELQTDYGLQWYDYGARMYDPQLSRFTTSDPLEEVSYDWTPYRYGYNNPMKYTDPTGMLESTHTDEDGNVLAVYDDGDNGVYKHSGKGDEAAKSVEKNYSVYKTSAGGKKMGESLHSLSFVDQSLYNETGEVQAANIKIDYGSTELTEKVRGILNADPSLKEYAGKAGTNGDWDLKSNTSKGSKLFGKYASPRDAGNFSAGAVAQKSSLAGIAQFGYGAYNLSGNSKGITGLITGAVGALTLANPALGLGAAYLIGKFGEDKLSQISIDMGKQYIKKNK